MRRCLIGALAAALLSVAFAASAAAAPPWENFKKPKGLSYGGRVFTAIAPDLDMRGPYEDRFAWRSGVDFRVKYKFADDARFAIGAKLRYQLRSGDRLEYDLSLDLDQTWFQFRRKRFTLRAGFTQLNWGRNALLSPLNALNPIDYTVAFDPEGADEARIPVLALRLNLNLHPVSLEAIWIPLYQPSRVSFYGRDFAVFRPGLLEQMLPTLVPDTGAGLVDDALGAGANRVVDAITGLDPYARDGLQSYLVASRPEETPWNSDLGARVAVSLRGVDFDFVVLWHMLDMAEIRLHPALRGPLLANRLPTTAELTQLTNPDAEIVTSTYRRSLMAGGDVAIPAGGLLFTAEAAFESTRVLYRSDLEPFTSPTVRWAAAVRYNFGTVFAFTAEFGHDIIVRPGDDLFFSRPHDLQAAFVATLRLLRDQLQISLTASYAPFQRDLYVHPRVTLELDDHLAATWGVQLFEGLRPDIEPTLDGLLSYQGGIVGWMRANDYAYATIEYRF